MKIPCSVALGRSSNGIVRLELRDEISGLRFLELEMSLSEFGAIVTGFSQQEIMADIRHLKHIGKHHVTEPRQVVYSGDQTRKYERDHLQEWLEENCREDGWLLDSYLGTQNSVEYKSGKVILNYRVERYVDREEDE